MPSNLCGYDEKKETAPSCDNGIHQRKKQQGPTAREHAGWTKKLTLAESR